MDNQNNGPEKTEERLGAEYTPETPNAGTPEAPGGAGSKLTVDAARYAKPEIDDPIAYDKDEAPTEWVPSRFEKRIKAIPENQWNLYQTLVGIVVGLLVSAALFLGGSSANTATNILFWVAIAIALVGPRILEDRGRRRLSRYRIVLIIVLLICIAAFTIYVGTTQGWNFMAKKDQSEAALRLTERYLA